MTTCLEPDLELRLEQLKEPGMAIKEADKGDFATAEEEAAVFNKWGIEPMLRATAGHL